MTFTDQEKELLKGLINYHLEQLKKGKESINEYPTPEFLAGEHKYEDVLRTILEKLG